MGATGFSQAGVLGILSCARKTVNEFEEDHAVTAVHKLDGFLARFCTPLGRPRGSRKLQPLACDEALKRHIMCTVLCLAADGDSHGR